jgi:hypothetical protein
MTGIKEETLRRIILVAAGTCWGVSLTLSWLIIGEVVSQVDHPGLGLIVFMAQGLGITLTVVWSQLRNRTTMVEVMRIGMQAANKED